MVPTTSSDHDGDPLLCRHCALRKAIVGTPTCRECLWRLTQLVFRPERFGRQEIEVMAVQHSDVVAFALTVDGTSRWIWTADGWPERKDTTTLR
jgi:hypothetical protein